VGVHDVQCRSLRSSRQSYVCRTGRDGKKRVRRIDFVNIIDSGLDFYFIHPCTFGKELTRSLGASPHRPSGREAKKKTCIVVMLSRRSPGGFGEVLDKNDLVSPESRKVALVVYGGRQENVHTTGPAPV
jgi:hypothetical protein